MVVNGCEKPRKDFRGFFIGRVEMYSTTCTICGKQSEAKTLRALFGIVKEHEDEHGTPIRSRRNNVSNFVQSQAVRQDGGGGGREEAIRP
jgi:hypothetical protein